MATVAMYGSTRETAKQIDSLKLRFQFARRPPARHLARHRIEAVRPGSPDPFGGDRAKRAARLLGQTTGVRGPKVTCATGNMVTTRSLMQTGPSCCGSRASRRHDRQKIAPALRRAQAPLGRCSVLPPTSWPWPARSPLRPDALPRHAQKPPMRSHRRDRRRAWRSPACTDGSSNLSSRLSEVRPTLTRPSAQSLLRVNITTDDPLWERASVRGCIISADAKTSTRSPCSIFSRRTPEGPNTGAATSPSAAGNIFTMSMNARVRLPVHRCAAAPPARIAVT